MDRDIRMIQLSLIMRSSIYNQTNIPWLLGVIVDTSESSNGWRNCFVYVWVLNVHGFVCPFSVELPTGLRNARYVPLGARTTSLMSEIAP